MSTAALLGMEAPLDCRDEWQRAMDDMSDLDLEADGDPARAAGLLRKRQDGLAINWGRKTVLILEFTRAFDMRVDWHILVDQHKTERYTACLGQVGLSRSCPSRWTSEGHTQSDSGPLLCYTLVCTAAKRRTC